MKNSRKNDRRSFMKKLSGTAIITGASPNWLFSREKSKIVQLKAEQKSFPKNDTIRLATIGMGIQGFNDTKAALEVPGVKFVAACDLYQGRLKRTKEVFGSDIDVYDDYTKILDREDVDAVIVATSDHWHDHISIAAMERGKAVYCEKPMVHHIDEGWPVLDSQKQNNGVFQVGSQRVSSLTHLKAQELYNAGEIGPLVLVETWNDRQSALGAWNYSIPRDASEETIDWKTFLGDAPNLPFDPVRFFRWRNYQDYGTGVAGDLFVHLFSGVHLITGSTGPNKIYTTGGLRYWDDGRDVPDVMIGCYDYPESPHHPAFNLQIRVNFIDGGGGGSMIRLVGTEGVMTVGGDSVKVEKNKMQEAPGYGGWDSFQTFDEQNRKEFEKWYKEKYPPQNATAQKEEDIIYRVPEGYSDHVDHFANFFDSMRTGSGIVEDATFGFRATAAALAANKSYFEQKVIKWDPDTMKLV